MRSYWDEFVEAIEKNDYQKLQKLLEDPEAKRWILEGLARGVEARNILLSIKNYT